MLSSILSFFVNLFCRPEQQQPQPQPQPQQPHRPSRPFTHGHDSNQINQSNEYYLGLRSRANEEGDAMAKCFDQGHQAYSSGDKAGAKTLSNRGKEHQQKMEALNKEASDWIYSENNKDSKLGEVDLHGLYVKEAIARTDQAIEEAKRRGDGELHLIVGKGLHSKGGAAKIKPAIEELMQKHKLRAELDPRNGGVLVVQINSATDRGFDPDEIARRLARDDGGCTIM